MSNITFSENLHPKLHDNVKKWFEKAPDDITYIGVYQILLSKGRAKAFSMTGLEDFPKTSIHIFTVQGKFPINVFLATDKEGQFYVVVE